MHEPVMFGYERSASDVPNTGANYRSSPVGAQRALAELEDRFERLSLVSMAMWSLLQDKTGMTEQELMERVHTLDLMDGTPDGKATTTVSKCRKCARTMAPRHRRCIYCGARRRVGSAFDNI